VQALVGRPTLHTPARTCVGADRARVLMLAAVLEKVGISLHDRDLFVNVAGGVRLLEPAADLGAAAAIWSSGTDRPIAHDVAFFGAVGLVGEIRAVSQPALRLREAARHGFRRVLCPASCVEQAPSGLNAVAVRSLREALQQLDAGGGR
jgi:DNA repair protein RadA/Sms